MKIIYITKENLREPTLAEFDIQTDAGMIFRRLRLVKSKSGKEFISPPSFQRDGQWTQYWEFASDKQAQIIESIRSALARYMAT